MTLKGGSNLSEKRVVDVELEWKGALKFDVNIRNTYKILVDASSETEGVGVAPAPDELLAAAVGSCLASSFAFCASKARAALMGLTVNVKEEVSRVEGRLRVTSINVTLNPKFAEEDDKKLERCKAIFRNYCTVTESVVKGIPVNVTVKT
ncbi:MAG: OsmC family protein [Candidatus Jordarchaeaceae archaeon]